MTKQVALRNETYERLKARKRDGESFSDVIDRIQEQVPPDKDPLLFLRRRRRFRMTMEEHLAMVEADRDADRMD